MRSRSTWGWIGRFPIILYMDWEDFEELVISPNDVFPTMVMHFLNKLERYMPSGEGCWRIPFPLVPGEGHPELPDVIHRQVRDLRRAEKGIQVRG